jgi:DNA ligase-1
VVWPQITEYLHEAVKGGAEGLMMKMTGNLGESNVKIEPGPVTTSRMISPQLPCPYDSGTRSTTWLKLKVDYVAGFADTIDVVPIGQSLGSTKHLLQSFFHDADDVSPS